MLEFLKNLKTLLNKGTEHKINDMGCLKLKIKILKVTDPLKGYYLRIMKLEEIFDPFVHRGTYMYQ